MSWEPPDRGRDGKVDLSGLQDLSPRRQRQDSDGPRGRGWRALGLVLAGALIVAIPWMLVSKLGNHAAVSPTGEGTPTVERSEPSVSPSQNPSATSSPTPGETMLVKGTYEITVLPSGVPCLRIRAKPGTQYEVLDCLNTGVQLASDGQTAQAGGITWLHVHDPFRNVNGWASTQYLRKVS